MSKVAIDGPAGAGKSTLARALAAQLGFTYVDTGAMYRAVALAVLDRGVDPDDADGAAIVAAEAEIELDQERVALDGRDVTALIRAADVTAASARVARHPGVRRALVAKQRRIATERDVVMEGRDIGTEVLPDADVKVFLTASIDERAVRRGREVGIADDVELRDLKTAIERRDESDTNRALSPLKQAPDAVVVDSTGKTIEGVVAEVVAVVRERLR